MVSFHTPIPRIIPFRTLHLLFASNLWVAVLLHGLIFCLGWSLLPACVRGYSTFFVLVCIAWSKTFTVWFYSRVCHSSWDKFHWFSVDIWLVFVRRLGLCQYKLLDLLVHVSLCYRRVCMDLPFFSRLVFIIVCIQYPCCAFLSHCQDWCFVAKTNAMLSSSWSFTGPWDYEFYPPWLITEF